MLSNLRKELSSALQDIESELDAMMEAVARSPKPSAALAQTSRFYEPALFALPSMMQDLNNHRSQRLSEQQSAYPAVHWLILTLLASSILLAFIFETALLASYQLDWGSALRQSAPPPGAETTPTTTSLLREEATSSSSFRVPPGHR